MNMYELTTAAAYLQQLLEDGDIDEQTFNDSLESMMVDEKIENVCKVIRNLEGLAAACKEEEQRIASKRRAAENGVKRLKDRLTALLTQMRSKKVEAGLFKVSLGTSTSCEVFAEDRIPEEFLTPQPPKVNKTEITRAIKEGQEVTGAHLVVRNYVTIK